MRSLLGPLFCVLVAALVARAGGSTVQGPAEATTALLESLAADARARASFAFDGEERFDWHFVPRERAGLPMGGLTPDGTRLLDELLKTVLSEDGVRKVEGVRLLEGVLREREGAFRDPDAYYLSVFGTPGDGEPWGLRFEGHHLSLNLTSTSRELHATTPWFVGTNPARVEDGEHEGLEVLEEEVRLARELFSSLTEAQRARAVRAEDAPGDVLFGPDRERLPVFRPGGLPAAAMDESQRELLRRLIVAYADDFQVGDGPALLRSLAGTGLDRVHFLWMGRAEDERFYYRIQGESFLVELDVTGPNHVHALWRDRDGDFGRDLLAEHRGVGR